MSNYEPELFWDSTYAVCMALIEHYPKLDPEKVGLNQLVELVQSLPGFKDDPAMVTERMLLDIYISWYEEASQKE